MTNEEIVRDYRQAANKLRQIRVLTDLNECRRDEIVKILEENGILGKMASVDVTDLGALTMWYGVQYKVLLGDQSRLSYKIAAMTSAIGQFGSYDSGTLDVRFTVSAEEVILSPFKVE